MTQATHHLRSECHLHLYGCLSVENLFALSEGRAARYAARFQWFLSEFEKATGRKINPTSWWGDPSGFATFKEQVLCLGPLSFDVFQAKFNLLIALFPPTPDDMTLARSVFAAHQKTGGYKEYRTFLPLYLTEPDRLTYLRRIVETAASFDDDHYHPRIAISFSRQNPEAWDSYRFLSDALQKHPELAPWITGIDFCANERGHPPSAKKALFQQINDDNLRRELPLEILYHVGEMWQDIALHSAARWCVEAAAMGSRRLGHALALGMDCHSFSGRTIVESKHETLRHLAWIRENKHSLHEFGYGSGDYAWLASRAERQTTGDYTHWRYDEDLIIHTHKFQDAAMMMVRNMDAVIETCPTSNMRIGALKSTAHHPLRRFMDHGLRVAIATDDPGIFDITLAREEEFARDHFGISEERLRACERLTESLFTDRGVRSKPPGHSQ